MRDEELIKYLSKNLITESKREPYRPPPGSVLGGPEPHRPSGQGVFGPPPKPDNPTKPIRLPIPNKEDETKKGKYGKVRYPTKPNTKDNLGETSTWQMTIEKDLGSKGDQNMNYKEYFKQQLVESIMEDTFAERLASAGPEAALQKAKYFKGLMSHLENRKGDYARNAAKRRAGEKGLDDYDTYRAGEDARDYDRAGFASSSRAQAMATKHMGVAPDLTRSRAPSFDYPMRAGRVHPDLQKKAGEEAATEATAQRGQRREFARLDREREARDRNTMLPDTTPKTKKSAPPIDFTI